MRIITKERAKELASDWHGGQLTALYALCSSGSIELYPGEGKRRIEKEIESISNKEVRTKLLNYVKHVKL